MALGYRPGIGLMSFQRLFPYQLCSSLEKKKVCVFLAVVKRGDRNDRGNDCTAARFPHANAVPLCSAREWLRIPTYCITDPISHPWESSRGENMKYIRRYCVVLWNLNGLCCTMNLTLQVRHFLGEMQICFNFLFNLISFLFPPTLTWGQCCNGACVGSYRPEDRCVIIAVPLALTDGVLNRLHVRKSIIIREKWNRLAISLFAYLGGFFFLSLRRLSRHWLKPSSLSWYPFSRVMLFQGYSFDATHHTLCNDVCFNVVWFCFFPLVSVEAPYWTSCCYGRIPTPGSRMMSQRSERWDHG